jgi:hypothetical protein
MHTIAGPEITPAEGAALTVILRVAVTAPQLPVTVYDIVAVPAATPVATPDALMVATHAGEALQVPPITEEANGVDAPAHTALLPVIVPADEPVLTVMIWVAVAAPQLPVTVYDIVAVPAETPDATPDELIVATDGEAELHTPPPTVLLNTVYEPTHIVEPPVIDPALAAGLTVITWATLAVPQLPVTV